MHGWRVGAFFRCISLLSFMHSDAMYLRYIAVARNFPGGLRRYNNEFEYLLR